MKRKHFHLFSLGLALAILTTIHHAIARSPLDTPFSLEHYDQEMSHWINPKDPSYDEELLDQEIKNIRKRELYQHLFGTLSPWSEAHVNAVLRGHLQVEEEALFAAYSNPNNPYYGQDAPNALPYPSDWLTTTKENSNLSQLSNTEYEPRKRGIMIHNSAARVLPTDQYAFLNPNLPGEGYPFDYLQMSAIWMGTPVYIIATTQDDRWSLVLTPDYVAWVKKEDTSLASEEFITTWSQAAQQELVAITQTAPSLYDTEGMPLPTTYVGACFPRGTSCFTIMVPVNGPDQQALIKEAVVTPEISTPIPLSLTPHHMATIMSSLLGRAYGWGGLDFNNDCSAELKSLFVPFGIYLPRHSSDQVSVGRMVEKTTTLPEERLSFLTEQGKPFLSLIYIGGHVVLYIGTYPNPLDPSSSMVMTYQNLWGLRPSLVYPNRRAIIGQSVLFPLLLKYPEDTTLVSLANKAFFQVSDLSQLPTSILKSSLHPMSSLRNDYPKPDLNLKSLMYPDHLYNKDFR